MAKSQNVKTDKPFTVFSMEADKDYLLARLLSFATGSFTSRAGFFAQQCCEKYMKAVMVHRFGEYESTHQLRKLAGRLTETASHFSEPETLDALGKFDVFDQVGRYGAAANFDPMAQRGPDVETAGVSFWSGADLMALDCFVSKTRALLPFEPGHGLDFLRAIAANRSDTLIVATWPRVFPPPQDVLFSNNKHFSK